MNIIRFLNETNMPELAVICKDNNVYRLPFKGFLEIVERGKQKGISVINLIKESIDDTKFIREDLKSLNLLVPIEAPEVWAAGVTYEKSKEERNYESTDGRLDAKTFYDKVYDADRPELFFKSSMWRTVGPDHIVYLRSDSKWQIPEPELGLVLDKNGEILGYTIGNDMSCRDIEGENPLYLPQAKIWRNSCSIGPTIRLAETVDDPYQFEIYCRIYREGSKVFEESSSVVKLKRKLEELISYLLRENIIFDGTVLLTGTSIVPPRDFTLLDGDRIEIEIPGIGILNNPVESQLK